MVGMDLLKADVTLSVRRIGFIDLGSNSCRLCVVEYDEKGQMSVLSRVKSMVRLGEGAFVSQTLQSAAINRTIQCLQEFAEIGRSFRVEKIVAIGTAALRMAVNRQAFLDTVKEQTGISIEIISGEEEARLIRVGIFNTLPKTKKSYLFIDIGGGSTELSISDAKKIDCLESINVGCVMVSDAVKKCKDGRVPWSRFEQMMTLVETKVQHALEMFQKFDFSDAIASSGTALAIYRLAALEAEKQKKPLDRVIEGGVLPIKFVEVMAKKLASMPLSDRQKLSGLSEARAEVIVGGAAVLLALMRTFKLKYVLVTESNLQDGQRFDFQARHYPQQSHGGDLTRKQHVKLFAKRYHYENAHCRQVERLAKRLYKQAIEIGLASEDERLVELLGYAARLHDVGIGIAYDDHYRHGAYLVRHSHLLGFTDVEIETMARLVYLHSRPSEPLVDFLGSKRLSSNEKMAAMSLFMAEMLDKTHRSVVGNVRWTKDNKRLKLEVRTSMKAEIEKAGTEKIQKHFKRLIGQSIKIEFLDEK